jgi:hypothetical protein
MKSGFPYVSSGRLTSIVTPSSSFITECSESSQSASSCVQVQARQEEGGQHTRAVS